MQIPHPIPYQGSKRKIARKILEFFPYEVGRLVEPFAGSAAITIAAAAYGKASSFWINDIDEALMHLWEQIINNPLQIANAYERLWYAQQGQEKEFYFEVRQQFNETRDPALFLYLLARCVKASIRYNARGEFNQSPDNRRRGRHPKQMKEDIVAVSNLLRGRVEISHRDYKEVLQQVDSMDLVYLDPPYQGVCVTGDPRYFRGVKFQELVTVLDFLNRKRVPFLLSYDGRTGDKVYGKELPSSLELHRVEINAGRSAQATLLGRTAITYESLYLSPVLLDRLNEDAKHIASQLSLALEM